MKKLSVLILFSLLSALLLALPVFSAAVNFYEDQKNISIDQGSIYNLNSAIYFTPEFATNCNVTWESSDISIVSVDESGMAFAKKEGTVTITVTSEDGNFTDTCTITVNPVDTSGLTGIKLNRSNSTISIKSNLTLSVTPLPETAVLPTVVWSSDNTSIATVDQNGRVKGISTGIAAITATVGNFSRTCYVYVRPQNAEPTRNAKMQAAYGFVSVDGDLSEWTDVPYASHDINLKNSIFNYDVTDYARVKSIWNEDYVYFLVEAKDKKFTNNEEFEFYIDEAYDKSAYYDYTDRQSRIHTHDNKIIWSNDGRGNDTSRPELYVDSKTIKTVDGWYMEAAFKWSDFADIYPGKSVGVEFMWQLRDIEAAVNKQTFQSSTPALRWNVNTMDGAGRAPFASTEHFGELVLVPNDGTPVTPVIPEQPGTEPVVKPTGIKLSESTLIIHPEVAHRLTAENIPYDSSVPITWKSSNVNVATVDSTGRVMGRSVGTVTITATNEYGFSASCIVEVRSHLNVTRGATLNSVYGTPAIDGNFSEWAAIAPSDTRVDMNNGWYNALVSGEYAVVKSMWDNDAVYFYVETNDKNLGDREMFEFYIDETYDRSAGFNPTDRQTRVYVNNGTLCQSHDGRGNNTSREHLYGGSKSAMTENGWAMEVKFLWSDLVEIKAGNTIGVEFMWDNRTNSGTTYYRWNVDTLNGATPPYRSTEDFGALKLLAPNVAVEGIDITTIAPGMKISTDPNDSRIKLEYQFIPASATNQNVFWQSSNTNVATVDNYGVVTRVGAGITTITATTAEGGFTDSVVVTVCDPNNHAANTPTYILGAVKADCLHDGHTGMVYCMYCHTMLNAGTDIPGDSNNHSWGEWNIINNNGVKEADSRCVVCNKKASIFSDKKIEVGEQNINTSVGENPLTINTVSHNGEVVSVTVDKEQLDSIVNHLISQGSGNSNGNIEIGLKDVIDNVTLDPTSAANNSLSLELELPNGTVAFDSKALKAMQDTASGNVNINLNTIPANKISELNSENTPAQEKKLSEILNDEDREIISAIDLDVTGSNGDAIHKFGEGFVTIVIDFDPALYNITGLKLQYIRENGVVEYYTPTCSDGKLIVMVPHLSTYLLTYDKNSAASAYSISGKVTSYNPNYSTTINLLQNGEIKYSTVIQSVSASGQAAQNFVLNNVAAGKYDMEVIKAGHLKYTIKDISVVNSNIDLTQSSYDYSNITLLTGDVNGDGSITESDVVVIRYTTNINRASEIAANPQADLNGDGSITESDVLIVRYKHHINHSTKDCTYNYAD